MSEVVKHCNRQAEQSTIFLPNNVTIEPLLHLFFFFLPPENKQTNKTPQNTPNKKNTLEVISTFFGKGWNIHKLRAPSSESS